MSIQEYSAVFGGSTRLVGVVTESRRPTPPELAAIFLNAGVIHRIGPSRLYVRLARRLAEAGWTAVRFDHSGIGDSPARRDGLPFEQSAIVEAREVMDAIEQTKGVHRFVLIGLCSGAVTAVEAASADPRVAGAVLINPQGFDESPQWNSYVQNRGDARRYWTRSLFSTRSWLKAATGRVDYRRLITVLWRQMTGMSEAKEAVVTVATRVGSILRGLLGRNARLLLLCSEGDDGIDYMNVILGEDIRAARGGQNLTIELLRGADHSLTLQNSQQDVVERVVKWAAGIDTQAGFAGAPLRTSDPAAPASAPELSVSQ